jgi:uncharacterized protein
MGVADLAPDRLAEALSGPGRAALLAELAGAGEPQAQALYGQLLLDGVEVARDRRAAFGWFRRAAAQGHLMALNMAGRCYDLGHGVAVDKARAAECFRVAAERGLAEAQYNYATLLALGQGVAQDRAAALAWLERSAAAGFAKAVNFIGSFREDGWACERDMAAAADCYARAAEGGDFRGMFNHARMLAADGRVEEALGWTGRAWEAGTPAFRKQLVGWLRASPVPALRERGRALAGGGGRC